MKYFDFTAFAQANPDEKMQRDALHFIAALQGLVNRTSPALYINCIRDADAYWLDKFTSPGGFLSGEAVETLPDIPSLLDAFAPDMRGLIFWDRAVPATANVASTICGVEGWLPADPDGGFFKRYLEPRGLPVMRDLRGMFTGSRTGSAKCDAYMWAKENFLDRGLCNDALMAFMSDAFEWRGKLRFDYDNAMLANHDYFVARKAFFFDLSPWYDEKPNDDPDQPLGCDYRTLCAVLASQYAANGGRKMTSIGGFVPWHIKYTAYDGNGTHPEVHTEWKYAEIISAYNAYMDAEAYGYCGMANASVYAHHPLKAAYKNNRPADAARPLEDKTYIMVYMGDYDSANWTSRLMHRIWDDPERGCIPLAWQFNPNLCERSPHAFDRIYSTLTPNDYIIAGDSGAGYLNPTYLLPPRIHSDLPQGMDVWMDHCEKYYRRFDIDITGFILNGFRPLTEEAARFYNRVSPVGSGYKLYRENPRIPSMIDGVPYLPHTADLDVYPEDRARRSADNLIKKTAGRPLPDFHIFRIVLAKPSQVREFFDMVSREAPDRRFEVVDPYTFFRLFRERETGRT